MRIVPIIKTVGVACNLKCRYCWFNPLDQSKVHLMPPELIEQLVRQYAEVDDSGRYQFIWHGGEPLMAGRPFFEQAVAFQRQYLTGAEVKNVIQTNGTMLSADWARFFIENDFKVGVSLDGPKEVHDLHRVTPRGHGSHDRIMANLVRARNLGLKFSVIATVSKGNVGAASALFRFFVDHGIFSFGFNMVYERGPDGEPLPFSLTNEEYARFQIEVFEAWLDENNPRIRVRHVDSILQGLLGLPVKSCIYAGTCSRFLNINSNGDVFPCERLTDAPKLGNLYSQSLTEIVEAAPYREHQLSTQGLPQDCRECRFLSVCRNGCTHHRTAGKLYFCEARKAVFRHMEAALDRLATVSAV